MFRKILLYVVGFMVSLLIIYSSYYYRNHRYTVGGFVADADTTHHILMRPHPYEPSGDNSLIYSAGIINALSNAKIPMQAAAQQEFRKLMPESCFTGGAGVWSEAMEEKSDRDVMSKFRGHPPLQFSGLKTGERLLFSYVYRNVELPQGFETIESDLDFAGAKVRYIRYRRDQAEQGAKDPVSVYISEDKKVYALKVLLYEGDEAWYYHADGLVDIVNSWKACQKMIRLGHPAVLDKNFFLLVPELDMFLTKTYTPAELAEWFQPQRTDFKRIEDRIKLKVSAQANKGAGKPDISKGLFFNRTCLFALVKKNSAFPYLAVLMNHPELLVRK